MLKLNIKNFFPFPTKEISLSPSSLILIQGDSGTGKSSVLTALLFCLYGGTGIAVPCPGKGSKSGSSVELIDDHKKLKVHRQTAPYRLQVFIQKGEETTVLSDGVAQNYIDSVYGDETLFLCSSVMRQKETNHFLTLSATDKMSLIETLTFDTTLSNREMMGIPSKEKIKAIIQEWQEKVFTLERQVASIEACIKSHGSSRIIPSTSPCPSTKEIEDGIVSCTGTISSLETELSQLTKLLTTRKELDQKMSALKAMEATILDEDIVRDKETKITEIQAKLDERKVSDVTIDFLHSKVIEYDSLISGLTADIEDLKKKLSITKKTNVDNKIADNKAKSEAATKWRLLLDTSGVASLAAAKAERETVVALINTIEGARLPEAKEVLHSHIKDTITQEALEEAEKEKNKRHKQDGDICDLICPSCGVSGLCLTKRNEGSGIHYSLSLSPQVEEDVERGEEKETQEKTKKERKEEEKRLKKIVEELERELSTHKQRLSTLDRIVTPPSTPLPHNTSEHYQERIDGYIRYKELVEKRDVACANRDKASVSLSEQEGVQTITAEEHIKLTQTLQALKDELRANHSLLAKRELLQEQVDECLLNHLGGETGKTCTEIEEDMAQRKNRLEETQKTLEEWKDSKEKRKLLDERTLMTKKLSQTEGDLTTAREKVEDLQFIRVKLRETKAIALAGTVQVLTSITQEYLDAFFDTGNMTVTFSTNKTQKKGKKSTYAFDMKIEHNGMTKSSWRQLSGGEGDRFSLALTLAFNQMTSSRLLLLDEVVEHVEPRLAEQVVSVLADYSHSPDKDRVVVMVGHHSEEGEFDQSILISGTASSSE